MQNNQSGIIERLFASFGDLEKAISSARQTLANKSFVPPEIVKRLESYDGILAKQKNLAQSLCGHITSGNWSEVTRHVNLINGLSAMIRDDARAILSHLSVNTDNKPAEAEDDDFNFC